VQEEERLWTISAVPLVPVLCVSIAYLAHLKSIGVISSFEDAFLYAILAGVLYLLATFGIYEVASSFKVERPSVFRAKRFFSRSVFAATSIFCLYLICRYFLMLFSTILRVQYILLLSLFIWAFAMAALVQNPRTRRFIKKLTQEEASYRT
jgi:uncharacterized membrane protein